MELNHEIIRRRVQFDMITKPEEEKRQLLIQALKDREGLEDVNDYFHARQWGLFTPRLLEESVLKYCLMRNDIISVENERYDYYRYQKLCRKIKQRAHIAGKAPGNPRHFLDKNNKFITRGLTLSELARYLSDPDIRSYETDVKSTMTEYLNDSLGKFVSEYETEEEAIRYFLDNYSFYQNVRESVRYYWIKYLYIFLCGQVVELLDILEIVINGQYDRVPLAVSDQNKHIKRVFFNWGEYSEGVPVTSLYYSMSKYISVLREGEDEDNQPVKERKKAFLKSMLKHFCLFGSPTDIESYNGQQFSILEGKPISTLRDQTALLRRMDTEDSKHSYEKKLESTTVEDFFFYKISYPTVYNLLFEELLMDEELDNEAESKGIDLHKRMSLFFKDILYGEKDVYRDEYLFFLAAMKTALYRFDSYTERFENDPSMLGDILNPFREENKLNVRSVNIILKRVGFQPLDLYAAHTTKDEFYFRLFDGEDFESVWTSYSAEDRRGVIPKIKVKDYASLLIDGKEI